MQFSGVHGPLQPVLGLSGHPCSLIEEFLMQMVPEVWKPLVFRAIEQGYTARALGTHKYKPPCVLWSLPCPWYRLICNWRPILVPKQCFLLVCMHACTHTQWEWGDAFCTEGTHFLSFPGDSDTCDVSPHTHCLWMLFFTCLLNPLCWETPGKPIRHAQTNVNPGSEPSLGSGWDIPPLPFHAELILKLDGKVRSPTKKL